MGEKMVYETSPLQSLTLSSTILDECDALISAAESGWRLEVVTGWPFHTAQWSSPPPPAR